MDVRSGVVGEPRPVKKVGRSIMYERRRCCGSKTGFCLGKFCDCRKRQSRLGESKEFTFDKYCGITIP